jgi:20S proteasome subunit alpha 6
MAEAPAHDPDTFGTHDEVHAEPDVSAVGHSASFSSDAMDGGGVVSHVNGHAGAPPELGADVSGSATSDASLSTPVSSPKSGLLVKAPEPIPAASSAPPSGSTEQEESTTDRANTPVAESQPVQGDKSLLTLSTTATLLSIDNPAATSLSGEPTVVLPENGEQTQELVATQIDEPPPSLTVSAASTTYGDAYAPVKPEGKGPKVPAANRLSISYEGGNRRIVFDAEVVDTITLFRREARAEVRINLVSDGETGLKGILVSCFLSFNKYLTYPSPDGNSLRSYQILPSDSVYDRFQ